MNLMIFTASPNQDGLTAACGQAAALGAEQGEASVQMVDLNQARIGLCQACGRGYGTCWTDHECQVVDDFQDLHHQLLQADGFVMISPVYWGEMSESAKAFFDRIRRCEGTKWAQSGLKGKKVVGIAAAGGSGRGTVSCLHSMQMFCQHVHADVFDLITITQKSRPYKLETIARCLLELVKTADDV